MTQAATPVVSSRRAAWAWAVAAPAVALAVLVVVSTAVRAWVGLRAPTPWINADEVVYAELGRSLYASGHFEILGHPTRFYSLVYPALVGGPLSVPDLELGYRLLKIVQASVMSASAIVVYFWSVAMMPRRWALVAAALTLALPGLAYSGLVMTEVTFLPIALLAAWTIARSLARPTLARQGLAVGTIALAAATRLQAIALLPAFVAAVVVYAAFGGFKRRVLRSHVPAFAALGCIAVVWSVGQLAGGGPGTNVLGAYRAAGETSYSLPSIVRFVVYHLADVVLLTMIVPACATIVLAIRAARRRERSPDVNAFLAVTVAFTAVFVLEVGTFASRHVGRLAERDLLVLAPLFLIGLALWLSRDAPVTRAEAVAISAGVLGLLLYLPANSFVSRAALPDAFTLAPLYQLRTHVPRVDLDLFLANIALPLVALFAFAPKRRTWAVAACIATLLVGTSVSASVAVVHEARALKPQLLGPDSTWIDRNAHGSVTYLYAGESRWNAVYENVFWNRRIDRVADIGAYAVPGPVPQTPVGAREDGLVVGKLGVPEHARYVVATTTVAPLGTKLATAEPADLALWHVRQPFRLGSWITGMGVQRSTMTPRGDLHASGDVASSVRLVAYSCARDELSVTFSAIAPALVEIRADDRIWTRRRVQAWTQTTLVAPGDRISRERQTVAAHAGRPAGVPAGTRPMRQCTFDVASSSPLHVERLVLVRHG